MSFLKSLIGKTQPPAQPPGPAPRIDPLFGDAEARSARAALDAGRWPEVEALLARTEDPNRRAWLVDVFAQVDGRPAWCDDWVDRTPGKPFGLLMRGGHSIQWAWEARGSGQAGSVTDEGWRLFAERLRAAQEDFVRAGDLDPSDAVSWGFRIVCATGLGEDEIVRTTLFEEARKRFPFLRIAHDRTLMGLLEKWGGSHAASFDFARRTCRTAPPGSPVHAILPWAHVERWLYYFAFDDDSDGAQAYFPSKVVQDELRAVHDLRFPAGVPRDPYQMQDRNTFAFCFWLAGDRARAAAEFRKLGPYAAELPWGFLEGGTLAAFTRARAACA
jgi:hypothetical protein